MPTEGYTGRFVGVIDPSITDLATVAAQLESRGILVEDQMDVLGTLVISGQSAVIEQAAGEIVGLRSIEPEGTVRTQD